MTTLEVATLVIAVVGAITGVLGLALSAMNYRRDRAKVKVSVTSGYLAGEGEDDFEGPYVFVSAVNEGRRDISLRSGGLLLPGDGRIWIKPGGPGSPNSLVGVLRESDQRQLWVHMDELVGELRPKPGLTVPTHGYVDDTTGRRWMAGVPPDVRDEIRSRVQRAQDQLLRPQPSHRP